MKSFLVAVLFLLAVTGALAAPRLENDDIEYYNEPAAGMRFRELEEPAGTATLKSGESSEEEPPSEPEKEAKDLEEQFEKEDKAMGGYNREALKEQLSENMHIVSDDEEEGQKEKELADALQAVKDHIVAKANQIKSEKRWVKEVTAIIQSYVIKTRRVNANIRTLQAEVKELFRKKKQIENMILQRMLEKKLRTATDDLHVLREALTAVQKKEDAFNQSKNNIRETIAQIEQELSKLRNKELAKAEAEKANAQ